MAEPTREDQSNEFSAQAAEPRTGLIAEFVAFLKDNKKWWLAPIIVSILLLVFLVVMGSLGGGAAAPFIYTLF
jgi:membrane glycosyltransferase